MLCIHEIKKRDAILWVQFRHQTRKKYLYKTNRTDEMHTVRCANTEHESVPDWGIPKHEYHEQKSLIMLFLYRFGNDNTATWTQHESTRSSLYFPSKYTMKKIE